MVIVPVFEKRKHIFSNPDLEKRFELALSLTHGRRDAIPFAVETVLYGYGGLPRIPRSPERNLFAERLTRQLHRELSGRMIEERKLQNAMYSAIVAFIASR